MTELDLVALALVAALLFLIWEDSSDMQGFPEHKWPRPVPNPEMKVLAELPDWAHEERFPLANVKEAAGRNPEGQFVRFTHCHHCGGWVVGECRRNWENTLEPGRLSGRKGYARVCPRCAQEIGFDGVVS